MKKFLVLYRMDMAAMHKMMETTSKEDQEKGMAEWGVWMKNNMEKFADPGAPVGKNWHVSANDASQMSNDLGGYSVVLAASEEEAAKFVQSGPHFMMPGATCDVMEIHSMGM